MMGHIVDGKDISLKLRQESFYIQDTSEQKTEFDLIELLYSQVDELEKMLKDLKNSRRYLDWLNKKS